MHVGYISKNPQLRNECLNPILALISTVNGESIYGVDIEAYGIKIYTICFKYVIYYARLRYALYTMHGYGYGMHYISYRQLFTNLNLFLYMHIKV